MLTYGRSEMRDVMTLLRRSGVSDAHTEGFLVWKGGMRETESEYRTR